MLKLKKYSTQLGIVLPPHHSATNSKERERERESKHTPLYYIDILVENEQDCIRLFDVGHVGHGCRALWRSQRRWV